jgi:hypothetical protein
VDSMTSSASRRFRERVLARRAEKDPHRQGSRESAGFSGNRVSARSIVYA